MLKFFRKIRQGLLTENKIGKYLIYGLGEIVLIVIGILIAIGVNNWNENRTNHALLESYQKNLITELKADLSRLKNLDNTNNIKKESIKKYFDYYNLKDAKTEVLLQKYNSINTSKRAFYTNAYTIEDLITTGSLSLFSESKRIAILKLKNIHEQYSFYETSTIQDVALYEQEIKKNFDLIMLNGLSNSEGEDATSLELDKQSKNFRILNNALVESLKLFEFQTEMYQVIIRETTTLLNLISEK